MVNASTANNTQSRAAHHKIFTFFVSPLDCTCNNAVRAPPDSPPKLAVPAKLSRSATVEKRHLDTFSHVHIFFPPFYKGRKRKCKGKSSWSNLPSSQLGHYWGWEAVAILRWGKADKVQLSTFSSGQYFKYLHSHVPFWAIASIRAFCTRTAVQNGKCYHEEAEHFPYSSTSGLRALGIKHMQIRKCRLLL